MKTALKIKKLLVVIVFASGSLMPPSVSFGGKSTDQARNLIRQGYESAKKDANTLVQEDLSNSLNRYAMTVAESPNVNQAFSEIIKIQTESMKTLDNLLADLNNNSNAQNEAKLDLMIETFKGLVRERFRAGLTLNELTFEMKNVSTAFKKISEDFADQCRLGHAIAGINYSAGYLPNLPSIGINANIQIGILNSNSNASFQSSNSTSAEDQKNRNQINGVTQAAASVTYSIAHSGAVGAAVTNAAALAPYMIGVAVAVAVVTAYINNAEQVELQNDIAEANKILLTQTPTETDVRRFYQQSCGQAQEIIKSVSDHLEQISGNEKYRIEAATNAKKMAAEISKFKQDGLELQTPQIRRALYYYSKKGLCPHKVDIDPKTSRCWRDDENAFSIDDPKIKISLIPYAADLQLQEDVNALKAFNDKYPTTRVAEYIKSDVGMFFQLDIENFNSMLTNIQWQALDTLQARAFSRIVHALEIYRQFVEAQDGTGKAIESELISDREFSKLTSEFKTLVAKYIGAVFERYPIQKLKNEFKSF